MSSKICIKCKLEKSVLEFHIDNSKPGGYKLNCKSCRKSESNIFYKKNKLSIDNRNKKYSSNNKEKIKSHAKNTYILNKNKINLKHKEYRDNNKNTIKIKRDLKKNEQVIYSKEFLLDIRNNQQE